MLLREKHGDRTREKNRSSRWMILTVRSVELIRDRHRPFAERRPPEIRQGPLLSTVNFRLVGGRLVAVETEHHSIDLLLRQPNTAIQRVVPRRRRILADIHLATRTQRLTALINNYDTATCQHN